MNIFKKLFVALSMGIDSVMPSNLSQRGVPVELSDQTEPEPERDEWTRMMHHDDVTPIERALLSSNNPADIKRAQESIAVREAEFQEWWDDKPRRQKAAFGEMAAKIEAGVTIPPIETQEGWEDDVLPEFYETVYPIQGSDQGKIVKVPYDLGEKLDVLIGTTANTDDEYRFVFEWLVEEYTDKGFLKESDYVMARHFWEMAVQLETANGNA